MNIVPLQCLTMCTIFLDVNKVYILQFASKPALPAFARPSGRTGVLVLDNQTHNYSTFKLRNGGLDSFPACSNKQVFEMTLLG